MIHFKYVRPVTKDEAEAIIKGAKIKKPVERKIMLEGRKRENIPTKIRP